MAPALLRLARCLALVAGLVVAQGATAAEGFKVTYKIQKGDSLQRIAKRYEVTVKDVRRWNKLGPKSKLILGRELIVYSLTPERPMRKVAYTVKRGDNLQKIAKKFKAEVKVLRQMNGLRPGRGLVAGKAITVLVPGPENPSKSIGRPQHGRLDHGEQLPDGPGYLRLDPGNAYGANDVVTHLMTTIPKVKKKWKNAPEIVIGDLSRKGGGHLKPHRSHQSGLDADIGYYFKVKKGEAHPERFRTATPETLDAEKTWFLIRSFLDTGAVDKIFVDYSLQKPLYDVARKDKGVKKAWLDKTFQYPRPKGHLDGVIRHQKSHQHHFHIRFKDTERNS